MAERRVYSHHPDYPELNRLANFIAVAKNPHLFSFDGIAEAFPEPERSALVATLESEMDKLLECGRFADVIDDIFGDDDPFFTDAG